MPVNATYPGVYINEVKSSVRTITGVPTSVAAFIGYAPRGPVNRPVHITGWADYEAVFGGLQASSPMSYAVYQFYLNGGSEAEIVRVVNERDAIAEIPLGKPQSAIGSSSARPPRPSGGAKAERKAEGDTGADGNAEEDAGQEAGTPAAERSSAAPLRLQAASRGQWGRFLRARVDHDTSDAKELKAEKEELKTGKRDRLFNLTVFDSGSGVEEKYLNASVEEDNPRYIKHLLASSQLVELVPGSLVRFPAANQKAEDGDPFGDTKYHSTAEIEDDSDSPPKLKDYRGEAQNKTGLYALLKTDIFNILCLPDLHITLVEDEAEVLRNEALELCFDRRAILLVDPPRQWTGDGNGDTVTVGTVVDAPIKRTDSHRNAAVYYPRIMAPDPLRAGVPTAFPPCGVMAGVLARTDVQRGVWKAAAGTDASLNGVSDLEVQLTDLEIGRLNPLGINCLRQLPAAGPVAWGARTMRGDDRLADEWKYLPVRRLALFVEESLFRGTQWVVFEPNDEPLWASIRLNVGAFMNSLFRAGAFQGRTPQEAYLVKCDKENNPQNDIDRGIVNIQVGFAPLKPAEFVIIHIQQLAGQIQV
ncbi:phage tail sheath subtilisin-like domain-containing protein [Streptomyces sp. ISL-10]|uniref:phage tail sheath family protein n=1 Tax=Streptomyces sp. ISL-10 TaxID=2819172 RepID=UPI001BEB0989|nr:phage tail sheath C-terminal domain-containing protein [Streptomyces sp. ISL-10]MBT2369851.1 phage tail sheath subtilisin-like domain-containing protein [Streptomyces sp. ISL-10]